MSEVRVETELLCEVQVDLMVAAVLVITEPAQ
jgi:hypothetical protein